MFKALLKFNDSKQKEKVSVPMDIIITATMHLLVVLTFAFFIIVFKTRAREVSIINKIVILNNKTLSQTVFFTILYIDYGIDRSNNNTTICYDNNK